MISMLSFLIYIKKYENKLHCTCQTQNLNYNAHINFAARTNYSTHTVFPGKDLVEIKFHIKGPNYLMEF